MNLIENFVFELESNLLTKEVVSGTRMNVSGQRILLINNSGLLGSQRSENWFY
jgi:hypothetical protein